MVRRLVVLAVLFLAAACRHAEGDFCQPLPEGQGTPACCLAVDRVLECEPVAWADGAPVGVWVEGTCGAGCVCRVPGNAETFACE